MLLNFKRLLHIIFLFCKISNSSNIRSEIFLQIVVVTICVKFLNGELFAVNCDGWRCPRSLLDKLQLYLSSREGSCSNVYFIELKKDIQSGEIE